MFHFYISIGAVVLCSILLVVVKYVSIHRWRIDRGKGPKQNKQYSGIDILESLNISKFFPIGAHQSWLVCYIRHGCRVWRNKLSITSEDDRLPVFGVYGRIRASSQAVLQLLKDISKTCDWKPGINVTSYVSRVTEAESNAKVKGQSMMSVEHDVVREEMNPIPHTGIEVADQMLFSNQNRNIVVSEYKRYWHRQDNGCCWLLQIDEPHQNWIFFLVQPVEEVDQSLLSVTSYQDNKLNVHCSPDVSDILLGIQDYFVYRKVQCTPLLEISLPKSLASHVSPKTSPAEDKVPEKKIMSKFRNFLEKKTSSPTSKSDAQKQDIAKSVSILRHRHASPKYTDEAVASSSSNDNNSTDPGSNVKDKKSTPAQNNNVVSQSNNVPADSPVEVRTRESLSPEHSSGSASSQSGFQAAQYRTIANHAAAEIMAEAMQASNLDLNQTMEEQMKDSGGWIFCGFDTDIVILKKLFRDGSNVQSYIGKGVIPVPPVTVWEAVKNPRTRFTYDESLKKVDVLETVSSTIKLVHYYHEVLQLFRKECCDIITLQNERIDGDKYIVAMQSVARHMDSAEGVVQAKMYPSGWIIEPAIKDNKIYSMVTYIMQIDFGPSKPGADKFPFEELISKQPLSISYLRQYLRPVASLNRKHSSSGAARKS